MMKSVHYMDISAIPMLCTLTERKGDSYADLGAIEKEVPAKRPTSAYDRDNQPTFTKYS